MKKILILLVWLVVATPAWAVKEFYSITKSIRTLGMGGTFYALSDDEYALFYNPAGLANYQGDGEFMFSLGATSGTSTFSALSKITSSNTSSVSQLVNNFQEFEGRPVYAGATIMPFYHRKNFALALLVGDVKAQFALLGNNIDSYVDITTISDSGLVGGVAYEFMDNDLKVGANFKGIFRAGAQQSYSVVDLALEPNFNVEDSGGVGFGVDMDLGAIYSLHNLPWGLQHQVGLSLNNLLASNFTIGRSGGSPPGLVRMLSLGYQTVLAGTGWFDHFRLMLDLAEFSLGGESDPHRGGRSGDFWKHLNLGVEAPINGWFVMRSGFHQGQLTFGVGLYSKWIKLDLATWGEELGLGVGNLNSRRFALRLAIGSGSPPPAPVKNKDLGPMEIKTPTTAPDEKKLEEKKSPENLSEKKSEEKLEEIKEEKPKEKKKEKVKEEKVEKKEEPKSESDKKLETLED